MRTPALVSLLLALAGTGGLVACPAHALDALDDTALQEVSGAGIAIALDDFEFAMAPTSYFEQVGSTPSPACTAGATGSVTGNINCWRRGDLRWYGVNISGAGGTNDGFHWNDSTSCSSNSLNCPRGGSVVWFAPFDNPYLIRAASPSGMSTTGTCVNGSGTGCNTPSATPTKSVYEFLAPSSQPNYTFSFWGEIEAGSTRDWSSIAAGTANPLTIGTGSVLQSQTLIRGNAAGSVFRMFQMEGSDRTSALFYHSRLRGDFRFSMAQSGTFTAPGAAPLRSSYAAGATGDAAFRAAYNTWGNLNNDKARIGTPPVFASTEGLHFRNVEAFIPLGQLYYQALTVNAGTSADDWEIALTPIPASTSAVYDKHYALNSGDSLGFNTALSNNRRGSGYCSNGSAPPTCAGGSFIASPTSSDYKLTHGFSRWGGWDSYGNIVGRNAIGNDGSGDPAGSGVDGSTTGDGIIFQGCAGCQRFYAFAKRPNVIDKRGETSSMQRTQNYNCGTGNTLDSCSVAASGGPVATGTGNETRTYPTYSVNLGDSRIEGLMLQSLRIQSCAAPTAGC